MSDRLSEGCCVAPLRLVMCPQCGGEGSREEPVYQSKWSYHGDNATVIQCDECGGRGEFLEGHPGDDGQPDEAQEWHDFDKDC